jgi:hypothetical protein
MEQRKILFGIFLFSFSSLAYEIALTRIFSISLWYHFAFMVISIAMLGIGASGTVLSLSPPLKASSGLQSVRTRIGIYGLLLGAGIPISYLISNHLPFDPVRLSWDRGQVLYICLYYLVLCLPFFFFGLSVSTALSASSERSGLLYSADLLGAGTGSVFLLYLMSVTGPEHAVLLISCAALTGAIIIGGRKTKVISLLLIASNAALLATPGLISPRMSPYKGLALSLKYPGAEHIATYYSPYSRIDTFRSPAVRFAPGLSLKYLDALPEQIGLAIDGGEINAVTNAESGQSLRFLGFLPSALAYDLAKRDDVLILDPKGGIEILLARYYNSGNIDKVQSNPLITKVIRSGLDRFSGGIYDTGSWTGIGRSWLKTGGKKFDLIDIPLTGTTPSGSFGIAEDYRFTVEAFTEYLAHLKEDGLLSIHLFIIPPPRTELRLLNTLVTSMEEMGIKEVEKRIVSIRSWGSVCIIAKRAPFTPGEIEAVRRFSEERRFDLVHLPGIREEETNIYVKMPSNEYFRAFREILDPVARKSFQRDYLFDITPVRDENPFFHYYLRLKNVKAIYETMGGRWQYFIEEGYILPAVFVQVLILSILLVMLPAFSRRRSASGFDVIARRAAGPTKQSQESAAETGIASAEPRDDKGKSSLLYFAFLGLGFMFVEVSLIQKMILPLENPSYALTAVLTSMLISSGLGSLLSYRIQQMNRPFILPVIALLVFAYSLLIPWFSDLIAPHQMPLKILFVCGLLIPPGLLMGIPFPVGIRNLGRKTPEMVPWAWAVNGCFSVLAPILAVMLAMVIGFKAVLWIGAGAYFLASLTFPAAKKIRKI